jgi:trigger factor
MAVTEEDVKPDEEPAGYKMSLEVQIENSGPCNKHISVKVPNADIVHFHNEAVEELLETAEVPGFRKGHVPPKLLQKRFKDELGNQVKQTILVQSLEQLSEENDIDPISEPNIDLESIDLPEEGDLEYEFDVEVRPEFDMPDYGKLKIERPVHETTDDDINAYIEKFLNQYGKYDTVEDEAKVNDYLSFSASFDKDGESVSKISEFHAQIKEVLRMHDAEISGFDALMVGAKPGDKKEVDVVVSSEAEKVELRGETLNATFEVKEIHRLELPELDSEFLSRIGFETEEDLREEVTSILERQTSYQQRQSARAQVLEKITDSADWDLPEQLVLKHVENALHREILEMQQAGFTKPQIQSRENELRQNAVTSTRQALKEHFVLDKIASTENIDVTPSDIESEIQMMAMQKGESPRRVRARLVKSGVIENLEAQIRERKAIDFILEKADFKDVPMENTEENNITAVPYSVCGEVESVSTSDEVDSESEAEE